jgi:hypothetical protein
LDTAIFILGLMAICIVIMCMAHYQIETRDKKLATIRDSLLKLQSASYFLIRECCANRSSIRNKDSIYRFTELIKAWLEVSNKTETLWLSGTGPFYRFLDDQHTASQQPPLSHDSKPTSTDSNQKV